MTPNQPSYDPTGARVSAGINILLGIWVFVSPWVYGAAGNASAWNSWIVGILVALFALIRMNSPENARGAGWINMVLGAWLFVSPWVYGYAHNTGRFVNSLCVGVVIFALSIYGASAHRPALPGRS
jgi:hypothetical protein